MDEETIVVIDDEGNEKEFEILFSFDDDTTEKKYVLYYDPSLEEPEVYSSIYDEDGNLYPVETQYEFDMIEEVFNAFMAEDEE